MDEGRQEAAVIDVGIVQEQEPVGPAADVFVRMAGQGPKPAADEALLVEEIDDLGERGAPGDVHENDPVFPGAGTAHFAENPDCGKDPCGGEYHEDRETMTLESYEGLHGLPPP